MKNKIWLDFLFIMYHIVSLPALCGLMITPFYFGMSDNPSKWWLLFIPFGLLVMVTQRNIYEWFTKKDVIQSLDL